jgi:cell division protein FtsB
VSRVAHTTWVNDSATGTIRVRALSRRRTRIRRLVDALVLAVILAAAGLCVSVYYRSHAELAVATSKHQSALDRVNDLKRENEKLVQEIDQLKSDPRMIEAMAREKLGFVRPGEIVIKIGEPDNTSREVLRMRASADESDQRDGEPSLTPRMGDSYTRSSN